MADSRDARVGYLRAQLREARVDGFLVTAPANIRYITGFTGSSALLMLTSWDALLITDARYTVQAQEEVGAGISVQIADGSLWDALWKHLNRSAGVKVIGFESPAVSHRDYERFLEGGARWQWRPLEDQVESLRQRKDRRELELIIAACALACEALTRTVPEIRVGLTESAVAGILEKNLRDLGSEGYPFPTIVASGPRSALPHARTATRELSHGDLVLIDFGAIVGGYCSDMTRTFVVGSAGIREREVHKTVRRANETAAIGVRVGMRGRAADALARDPIESAGYGPHFVHGLGHGIGLDVHEAPRLGKTVEATLPSEAVVTIEPGIYIQGWGGVRIEDDVYLGSDGPKVLTGFTRELIELK